MPASVRDHGIVPAYVRAAAAVTHCRRHRDGDVLIVPMGGVEHRVPMERTLRNYVAPQTGFPSVSMETCFQWIDTNVAAVTASTVNAPQQPPSKPCLSPSMHVAAPFRPRSRQFSGCSLRSSARYVPARPWRLPNPKTTRSLKNSPRSERKWLL